MSMSRLLPAPPALDDHLDGVGRALQDLMARLGADASVGRGGRQVHGDVGASPYHRDALGYVVGDRAAVVDGAVDRLTPGRATGWSVILFRCRLGMARCRVQVLHELADREPRAAAHIAVAHRGSRRTLGSGPACSAEPADPSSGAAGSTVFPLRFPACAYAHNWCHIVPTAPERFPIAADD